MQRQVTRAFTFIFICLSANALAAPQVCNDSIIPSTPESRFVFLGEGHEVSDKVTGLIWKRCPVGRSWTGINCDGLAMRYDWKSALALGDGNQWRLPNIKELESISEVSCSKPALNLAVFPGTPKSEFSRLWSATPYLHHESRSTAWYFHPDSGSISIHDVSSAEFVRLVRDM